MSYDAFALLLSAVIILTSILQFVGERWLWSRDNSHQRNKSPFDVLSTVFIAIVFLIMLGTFIFPGFRSRYNLSAVAHVLLFIATGCALFLQMLLFYSRKRTPK